MPRLRGKTFMLAQSPSDSMGRVSEGLQEMITVFGEGRGFRVVWLPSLRSSVGAFKAGPGPTLPLAFSDRHGKKKAVQRDTGINAPVRPRVSRNCNEPLSSSGRCALDELRTFPQPCGSALRHEGVQAPLLVRTATIPYGHLVVWY
jgi:hypothetical protein